MTVNRNVGYTVGSSLIRGQVIPISDPFDAGYVFTRVRVSAKLVFGPGTYSDSAQLITGVWGGAIQVGLDGTEPPAWNSSSFSTSIFAFDSADPDANARVFWAPSSDTVALSQSVVRTLDWKGQYHNTETVQWYYVPVDVTDAAETYYADFAWQIWYAT